MKRSKSYKLFFIIITVFVIILNISTVKAYLDTNSVEYRLREEEAKQIINSANPYPSSSIKENSTVNSYNNSVYNGNDYNTEEYMNVSVKTLFLVVLIIIIISAVIYLSLPIYLRIKSISFSSKKTLILFILMHSLNIYCYISIFYLFMYGKGLARLLITIIYAFISYFILKKSINNIPTEHSSNTNNINNQALSKVLSTALIFNFWFIPFWSFALHCYATYLIQKSEGFWVALIGFCLPPFSEIYCTIITISDKGVLNTFTQFMLVFILMCISTGITNYLINEENK